MKQKPAVEPINETKARGWAYKMKQKPAVERDKKNIIHHETHDSPLSFIF